HLDAQQLHAVGNDAGRCGGEVEPEVADGFLFGLEDGLLVIEFIVLLGYLITVVGHLGWAEFLRGRRDGSRIIAEQLNQVVFARRQAVWRNNSQLRVIATFGKYRLDTGMCILDKRPGMPLKIDGFIGIEKKSLFGFYLQEEVFERSHADDVV